MFIGVVTNPLPASFAPPSVRRKRVPFKIALPERASPDAVNPPESFTEVMGFDWIVYICEATALLVKPVAVAIAFTVAEDASVKVPVYFVELVVGVVPLVV